MIKSERERERERDLNRGGKEDKEKYKKRDRIKWKEENMKDERKSYRIEGDSDRKILGERELERKIEGKSF